MSCIVYTCEGFITPKRVRRPLDREWCERCGFHQDVHGLETGSHTLHGSVHHVIRIPHENTTVSDIENATAALRAL